MAKNTLSFNKTFVLFGFAALALIVAGFLATMPTSGQLQAHERMARGLCHTEQVALDQGYGVSRVVERRVCDDY